MHLFYIHEANGDCLPAGQPTSPVTISGGIILKGRNWDKTHLFYESILSNYFGGNTPANFVLQASHLIWKNGAGHFAGDSTDKRHGLVKELLNLLSVRKHFFYYFAINTKTLQEYDTAKVQGHGYYDLKTPYLVACDHLISAYNQFTKEKLGGTERAFIILDEKHPLQEQIEAVTWYRKYGGPASQRAKCIAEFSYPVNPAKNMMVQLSGLLLCITARYLEIENGYGNYTADEMSTFKEFYKLIDNLLIYKRTPQETGRNAAPYNEFIGAISVKPSVLWKTKVY